MDVKFKKISKTATTPTRGTEYSAGYDLYTNDSDIAVVKSGETVMFGSGIALEIPHGFFGAIFARSGLSTRQGLRPSTCVSVIDSDYRGEIKIPIYNDSDEEQIVLPNTRIAQLVILPYLPVNLVEADELLSTDRGNGGFGSTGI